MVAYPKHKQKAEIKNCNIFLKYLDKLHFVVYSPREAQYVGFILFWEGMYYEMPLLRKS